MSGQTIRIGIIGTGSRGITCIGRQIAQQRRELDLDLTALCNRTPSRMQVALEDVNAKAAKAGDESFSPALYGDPLEDDYGVYSFSGYGRRNVEFHVIKALDEPLSDTVHRRIDGTDPARATRMGAAIRHAAVKLACHPARIRLLLILSDGRPEDQDYGTDADDRDYGLLDTRKALSECSTTGIVPFMITIDREGDDYLAPLCGDIGYEVIDGVTALPRRLPEIYRLLTS